VLDSVITEVWKYIIKSAW